MKSTRSLILQSTFEDLQINGFNQLRPDKAIEKLGISKGAFYHYFAGKEDLLLTLVDEIILPNYKKNWITLENSKNDSISAIQNILQLHIEQTSNASINNGCITTKLIHEICHQNTKCEKKIKMCIDEIINLIENKIETDIQKKVISKSIDANHLAHFILSVYNGSGTISKIQKNNQPYLKSIKACIILLEKLRNNS